MITGYVSLAGSVDGALTLVFGPAEIDTDVTLFIQESTLIAPVATATSLPGGGGCVIPQPAAEISPFRITLRAEKGDSIYAQGNTGNLSFIAVPAP
jgi:hypothetical protein